MATKQRPAAEELATLLRISVAEARVVADPLALPAIARKVEAQRDAVVTLLDDDYPPLLRQIDPPPAVLYFAGDASVLSRPSIAIVGSRRATPYGINVARKLARELSSCGFNIVSGFARGIDAAAHDEAILSAGITTAVLGTGIDIDYPRGQRGLRRRIEENGVVISEFAPGTVPHAMNFPVRNRIIAGLSVGTVVVEASERSGSLITARLAAEQGREVFAVPGSIFSTASVGAHRLIQNGAKLASRLEDITEELGAFFTSPPKKAIALTDEETKLLEQLSFDHGVHVDTLAVDLSSSPAALAETLLLLELRGAIRALPGQRYVKAG